MLNCCFQKWYFNVNTKELRTCETNLTPSPITREKMLNCFFFLSRKRKLKWWLSFLENRCWVVAFFFFFSKRRVLNNCYIVFVKRHLLKFRENACLIAFYEESRVEFLLFLRRYVGADFLLFFEPRSVWLCLANS